MNKVKDFDLFNLQNVAYTSIYNSNYKKNPHYLRTGNLKPDKSYTLIDFSIVNTPLSDYKAVAITVQDELQEFYTVFHQFHEGIWLTKIFKRDKEGNLVDE